MTKPQDTELQRRPSADPVLGRGTSADHLQPPLRPGDREAVTYFELEQRRRSLSDDPVPPSGISADIPPLPASSPWASDPVPDEPTIDRTEDGDTINIHGE
jgi:hypothetical protein